MKKTDEYKWLSEVSNNVAKQAVKDCCNAYKNFFKGLSDKPRFKSRKKSKPSFYNDNVKLKRSEEHTSELQSRQYLVCRLLLEKKKNNKNNNKVNEYVNQYKIHIKRYTK